MTLCSISRALPRSRDAPNLHAGSWRRMLASSSKINSKILIEISQIKLNLEMGDHLFQALILLELLHFLLLADSAFLAPIPSRSFRFRTSYISARTTLAMKPMSGDSVFPRLVLVRSTNPKAFFYDLLPMTKMSLSGSIKKYLIPRWKL